MEQFPVNQVRRNVSLPWLKGFKKPVWIVNGNQSNTAVAAIVPADIYHKLQNVYGPELEKLQ